MQKKTRSQVQSILEAGVIMCVGLFLFKFIPMSIWGQDIRFDASAHVTISMFVLYIIWFFVDQNKTWGVGFFVFSVLVLSIVSIQRILVDAHSDIGLLAGFILSSVAILYAQRHRLKGKFKF